MSISTPPRALALAALLTLGLPSAARAQQPTPAPEDAYARTLAEAHALTLAEAIAGALEKNDGIRIEREAFLAATAAIDGAKGAYDPLLEVETGWRRSSLPVNSAFSGAPAGEAAPTAEGAEVRADLTQLLPTGATLSLRSIASRDTSDGTFDLLSPAYGTQLGLELRQPLLRDRTVDAARLGLRVAAADRQRAGATLERQVAETVAAVERAYWRLTAVRLEVGVREEAMRLADEQLSETRVRIEEGAAPETELAQPRAELERRRGELLAAQEAVARAENALKLLILGDGDRELWSRRLAPAEGPAVEIVSVDVAAEMDRALAARPEVAAAAAAVERRRAEAAFARDGVRPVLDAVVSYDRFGLAGRRNPAATPAPGVSGDLPGRREGNFEQSLESLGDDDFDDARVALVLGIPLGNRTARATAAIAGSVERQAEADLVRLRKEVRAEVLDAAAALETAGQRIAAARAAREAAEVQLSAEKDRYAAGLSTNFLVLTRQNDLARARLDEIAAETDYRTARTELARATGSLLAERGIAVDETNGGSSS